ncbi:MAG: hypothetical protein QOF21_2629 [Actinomycetota bacterium]|jgi:hypothetical protein
MSGYVVACYSLVAVTLVSYAAWVIRSYRSRG